MAPHAWTRAHRCPPTLSLSLFISPSLALSISLSPSLCFFSLSNTSQEVVSSLESCVCCRVFYRLDSSRRRRFGQQADLKRFRAGEKKVRGESNVSPSGRVGIGRQNQAAHSKGWKRKSGCDVSLNEKSPSASLFVPVSYIYGFQKLPWTPSALHCACPHPHTRLNHSNESDSLGESLIKLGKKRQQAQTFRWSSE